MTLSAAAVALAIAAAPAQESAGLPALARALAAQVVAAGPVPPVAISVGSAPSLSSRDGLATLLASELARSRLAPFVVAARGGPAEERARALGAGSLVRLALAVEKGQLVARGDLLGTWVNFWSGRTPTRPPAPAALLWAAVPVDAALASWLPLDAAPTPLALALAKAPLARLPEPLSALAAGDLDGDGLPEVLALTADELLLLAADGRELARFSLAQAPRAKAPSREPTGLIQISKDRRVGVMSSAHAGALWLTYDPAQRRLTPAGTADTLEVCGAPARLTEGENTFRLGGDGPRQVACARLERSGTHHSLSVLEDGTGLWDGRPVAGLGAASTLASLWPLSPPTLVSTLFQPFPEPDLLRVGPPERPLATVPVPGRVLQLVGADLDGDGTDELLLGVWHEDGTSEVRVVERVAP